MHAKPPAGLSATKQTVRREQFPPGTTTESRRGDCVCPAPGSAARAAVSMEANVCPCRWKTWASALELMSVTQYEPPNRTCGTSETK